MPKEANSSKNILLLEDDEILSQTLLKFLTIEGYNVTLVNDGEEALEATYNASFDLYLLDVNVPLLSGMDFLKLSRDSGDKTPAFFITALIDINSLSKGFDNGCDDYIKKPFDIDELLIRIKSSFKRHNPSIEYQNIKFDLLDNRVYMDNVEVNLGRVEKDVFAMLIKNIGITTDKSMFFDVMNKPSETGLRALINKLRKILNIDIVNIKSIGYKLEKF